MTNVNANINVLVNTSQAVGQLRSLQAQVNSLNASLASSGAMAASRQAAYNKALADGAAASGMFNAKIIPMSHSVDAFSKSLDKGHLTLSQYSRGVASQLPGMSKVFRREFDMMANVAESRIKRLQTQYTALGNSQKALALTPTGLAPGAASSMAMATQKQMMMNKMISDGSTKLLNWGKNTQWAGRQLMVGFTLPLAAFGAVAAKTFMDLDKQARDFKRVYGDAFTPPAEIQQNLEAVKSLGKEYTKYGIKVSDTMNVAATAAAAGMKNEKLVTGTEESLRLATIGQIDYQQALTTTITLQNAFKVSNEDMATTVDFIGAVANQTVLSVDDMTKAIPRVAPVIAGLGGDIKDLSAFLVAMREGGVSAEQGANALKSGLASLINPTKNATEATGKFGINLKSIIESNRGDLMGTVQSFGKALSGIDKFSRQQVLEKVFGKYQYARLGALFDNINQKAGQTKVALDLAGKSAEELGTLSAKSLSEVEQSTTAKFQGAVERMKLAIAPIGEAFLKVLTPILGGISKIGEAFNNLPDSVKNVIGTVTVLAGLIAPVGLMLVGLFGNAIANGVKFVQMLRKTVASIRGNGQAFKWFSGEELDAAASAKTLEGSSSKLTDALLLQQGAVQELITLYGRLATSASTAAGTMSAAAGTVAGAGVATTGAKAAGPRSFFTPMGRLKGYANGVTSVPGSGNKDTIPALLTPGESVVTKGATQKYGPIIAAMNAGTIQGFNDGLTPFLPGVTGSSQSQFTEKGSQAVQSFYASVQHMAGAAETAARILEQSTAPLAANNRLGTGFIQQMKVAGLDVPTTPRVAGPDIAAHMTQSKMYGDLGYGKQEKVKTFLGGKGATGQTYLDLINQDPEFAGKHLRTYGGLTAGLSQGLNTRLQTGVGSQTFLDEWNREGSRLLPSLKKHGKLIDTSNATLQAVDRFERDLATKVQALAAEMGDDIVNDERLDQATKELIADYRNGSTAQRKVAAAAARAANAIAGVSVTGLGGRSGIAAIPGVTQKETPSERLWQHPSGVTLARESMGEKRKFRPQRLESLASHSVVPEMTQAGSQGGSAFVSGATEAIIAGQPQITQAAATVSRSAMAALASGGNAGVAANSPSKASKQTVGFYLQGAVLAAEQARPVMYEEGYKMFDSFSKGGVAAMQGGLNQIKGLSEETKAILRSELAQANTMVVGGGTATGGTSLKQLASQMRTSLSEAMKSLTIAFNQIPAFASEVIRNIKPIFSKIGQIFLELNPWALTAANSIKHFFTQLSYTWMGLKITGVEAINSALQKAKNAYETAMLKAMYAWDSVKRLPDTAKNAYQTAMLKTMYAWDSMKTVPGKIKEMASRLMTQASYTKMGIGLKARELGGRVGQGLSSLRGKFSKAGQVAQLPVPRALAISAVGDAAQRKLSSTLSAVSQSFEPIKNKAIAFGDAMSAGAKKISMVAQLLADPLGRATVVSTFTKMGLEKLNAGLAVAKEKLAPIGKAFGSVVDATRRAATILSNTTKLLMDPLGRAVVISTMSKKLQQAFSNAVLSVRAGATRVYESLLLGGVKIIIGAERVVAGLKGIGPLIAKGGREIWNSMKATALSLSARVSSSWDTLRLKTMFAWDKVVKSVKQANLKKSFVDAGAAIKKAALTGATTIRESLMSAAKSIASAGKAAGGIVGGVAGGLVGGAKNWWNTPKKGFDPDGNPLGPTRGQNITKATNATVMGLMGVSMAASMVPGPMGEMAQKIMPVTMGLMGLQMMLPMFTNPLGLAILAIGAVTAVLWKMKSSFDSIKDSALKLGESVSTTTKQISDTGAFYGKKGLVPQKEAKAYGTTTAKLSKAQEYLKTDVGKSISEGFGTAFKELGSDTATKNFSTKLATMVLQGVISADEASNIANAIEQQFGIKGISARINGELSSLIGPDGKDVIANGITVAMNIQQRNEDVLSGLKTATITEFDDAMKKLPENFKDMVTFMNADAEDLTLSIGVLGHNLADIDMSWAKNLFDVGLSGKEEWEKFLKTALATGDAFGNNVKAGYDNLAAAQERLNNAQAKAEAIKNPKKRKEALDAIDKEREKLKDLEQQTVNSMNKNVKWFRSFSKVVQDKVLEGNINSLRALYKDTAQAPILEDLLGKTGGLKDVSARFNLEVGLSSGEISPTALNQVFNLIGNNDQAAASVDMAIRIVGVKDAGNLVDQLALLDEKLVTEISMDIPDQGTESLKLLISGLEILNQLPADIRKTITTESFGSEEAIRLGQVTKNFDKIPKNATKKRYAQFFNNNFDKIKFGVDWFSKLPDSVKKSFLATYTVHFSETGELTPAGLAAYNAAASKKGSGLPPLLIANPKLVSDTVLSLDQKQADQDSIIAGLETTEDPPIVPDDKAGGSKSNPIKELKDSIYEKLALYTNIKAGAKKLLDSKEGIDKILNGISTTGSIADKLNKLGLSESLIADILSKGSENAAKIIKKFGSKGLKALDQANLAGSMALRIEGAKSAVKKNEYKVAATARLKSAGGFSDDEIKKIVDDEGRAEEIARSTTGKMKKYWGEYLGWLRKETTATAEENAATNEEIYNYFADKMNKGFDTAESNATLGVQADFLEKNKGLVDKIASSQNLQINNGQDLIDGLNEEISKNETIIGQFQDQIDIKQREVDIYQHKNDLIQQAIDDERRQDELRMRTSDALSHELELMSKKEDDIRKSYDARVKALDTVASINQHIIDQQNQQLGLAQALSQGDIYAAAQAQQQMQASSVQYATDQVRAGLQTGMENQVAGLRTSGGLSRAQAEEQIAGIKEQSYQLSLKIREEEDKIYNNNLEVRRLTNEIYNINNDLITPLANQNAAWGKILENEKKSEEYAIRRVTFAGLTRAEWEKQNKEFTDAIENAKNLDGPLGAIAKRYNDIYEGAVKAANAAKQAPGGVDFATNGSVTAGQSTPENGKTMFFDPGSMSVSYRNAGGMIKRYATGGQVGMDSVPAMLTPGEFVMRKASVDKYGKSMLSSMNMGAFNMPKYNVGRDQKTSVKSQPNVSNINAPVYNTYSISVPVTQPGASADEIANKVMTRIKNVDNSSIRRINGY